MFVRDNHLVAYDEALAERIRAVVDGEPGLTEKKMFGGLAFLIHGNMSVAASGQGGMLVHIDPDESDDLLALPGVRPMEMRGKTMRSWLYVDDSALDDGGFEEWVIRGVESARARPRK